MNGKEKCMMLKRIRQRIAEANDIPYTIEECNSTDDCTGTCPRCEEEIAHLADMLNKKCNGKPKLEGVAKDMIDMAMPGCSELFEKISEWEKQGKVLVIEPESIHNMKTLTTDKNTVMKLYNQGYEDARKIINYKL